MAYFLLHFTANYETNWETNSENFYPYISCRIGRSSLWSGWMLFLPQRGNASTHSPRIESSYFNHDLDYYDRPGWLFEKANDHDI
jgi:hypothetical protein